MHYLIKEKNLDIDGRDAYRRTPLHLATAKGTFINISKKFSNKSNALCLVFYFFFFCSGHIELVKYMIDTLNADPTLKDNEESSLVHFSASSGNFLSAVLIILTANQNYFTFHSR